MEILEDWAFLEPLTKVSPKSYMELLEDWAFWETLAKASLKTIESQWKTELVRTTEKSLSEDYRKLMEDWPFWKSLKKVPIMIYIFLCEYSNWKAACKIACGICKMYATTIDHVLQHCWENLKTCKTKWPRNLIPLPSAILILINAIPFYFR